MYHILESNKTRQRLNENMNDNLLPTRHSDVVIIGAGFSGINFACQLQRKLGVTDYVIYDRAADFGGTWFANRCETWSTVPAWTGTSFCSRHAGHC